MRNRFWNRTRERRLGNQTQNAASWLLETTVIDLGGELQLLDVIVCPT